MMKNILAFDCSSNTLSVYLKTAQGEMINSRDIGLRHSERLMVLIDQMLKEAGILASDLDLIACSEGPGSFTGLRIAMACAKGISLATKTPLVSIMTLDWLKEGSPQNCLVMPLIDAKKQRYYCGLYFHNESLIKPMDIAIEKIIPLLLQQAEQTGIKKVWITGPDCVEGFAKLQDTIGTLLNEEQKKAALQLEMEIDPLYQLSRIAFLAKLAEEKYQKEGADPTGKGPLYIRLSEAEENALLG